MTIQQVALLRTGTKPDTTSAFSEAQKDLAWWAKVLLLVPERSIQVEGRDTSAKKYLASDAQPLRQDTRHQILAPMTPGAFHGWLPYSLAPGASGGASPYTFPSGRY